MRWSWLLVAPMLVAASPPPAPAPAVAAPTAAQIVAYREAVMKAVLGYLGL